MLEHEPETLKQMKSRFIESILEPVDASLVLNGMRLPPSGERKHVFDFDDGMRLIVSIDQLDDSSFLHISASGNEAYAKSIESEGLAGWIEDILLRVTAFTGGPPSTDLQSVITNVGVLHIMFEVDHDGLIERCKRA